MVFRYNYSNTDAPNRTGAGGDPAPTRGTVDGATAPVGTRPDLLARDFYRARVFVICRDGGGAEVPAGTADIQVWFRDMVEIGDADNVSQNPPPPDKVAWVKGPEFLAVSNLEEKILEDIYKRGVYIQVVAVGGGAVSADIFAAPFDRAYPWKKV